MEEVPEEVLPEKLHRRETLLEEPFSETLKHSVGGILEFQFTISGWECPSRIILLEFNENSEQTATESLGTAQWAVIASVGTLPKSDS